jgi:hypothetical protein
MFSVKSAYNLEVELQENNEGEDSSGKNIGGRDL